MRKSTAEQRADYVARQRGFDPLITEENYVQDLIRYQNYHNANTDTKHIRRWALDYAKRKNPSQLALLERATDFELRSIGIIGRAIGRDYPISLNHITKIDSEIDRLVAKYGAKPEAPQTKVVTLAPKLVEDRTAAMAAKHAAEVDAAIDEYLTNDTAFSMKGYVTSAGVSGSVAKAIAQKFVKLEQELQEAVAGKDAQLKEAYAHLGKVKLKRFYGLVQQIIVDCAQQVVTAKVRAPRVRKEKPPGVLAAKMKYLKQFDELKLVSEKPEKIVGADTVWAYDTERRRIFVYVADSGQKLSVKGTTITGFSVSESGVKTLRKPEVFLTAGLAKRTLMTNFKDLKTKQGVPNGRTSEHMIILKAF
jgi:hypothetical protein